MRYPKNLIELYSGSDLDKLFKGSFINFGYWTDLEKDKTITETEVIEANKTLYYQTFQRLNLNTQDRVLEVGCGHGAGSALLLKSYPIQSMVGLDCLMPHIERSTQTNAASIQKGKINFVHGQIESTQFANNSFNKIYTVEAFQHFSTEPAVAELTRILSDDGKLVISTFFAKNTSSYKELTTLLPRPAILADNDDETLAALPDVLALLNTYKFEDIRIEKIGCFVWAGYHQWVKQNVPSIWDTNWLLAYQKELLDYYIITAQRTLSR